MASKGAVWIWLTLLAIRGLAVYSFSTHLQQAYNGQQEEVSKEAPAPSHHYRLHKVQVAACSFILLS